MPQLFGAVQPPVIFHTAAEWSGCCSQLLSCTAPWGSSGISLAPRKLGTCAGKPTALSAGEGDPRIDFPYEAKPDNGECLGKVGVHGLPLSPHLQAFFQALSRLFFTP